MHHSTRVTSTTGTAPIDIAAGDAPGTVYLFNEDTGAGQAYPIHELLAALRAACPEGVSA